MRDLIRVGASQLQSRSYLLQSTHANTDDHKLLSSFPVGGNSLYLHIEGLVLAFVPEVLHVLVVERLFLLPEDGRYMATQSERVEWRLFDCGNIIFKTPTPS